MSRTLEYQLKGKSDVQQVVNRAKASMSQLDQAVAGIGRKFSSFGKDFAMSFLAPMVLLNKAIDMIAAKIDEAKRKAEEGMQFLTSAESASYAPPWLRAAALEAARLKRERERAEAVTAGETAVVEEKVRAEISGSVLNRFLAEIFSRLSGVAGAGAALGFDLEFLLARIPGLRELMLREVEASTTGTVSPYGSPYGAPEVARPASVTGNVIGFGQSAVLMAMDEQNQILRQIANNTAKSIDPPQNLNTVTSKEYITSSTKDLY